MVYRKQGTLATQTFRKTIDQNSYLHYESFHPVHLQQNLPFGQFLRIRRNSTDSRDYQRDCRILRNQLENRGYLEDIIRRATFQANGVGSSSLFHDQRTPEVNRITCDFQYTFLSNSIRRILLKHI